MIKMLHYVINSTDKEYVDDEIDYEEICKDWVNEMQSDLSKPVIYSEFEKQIASLFDKCFTNLVEKDVEYAGHGDAFEAFREAAKVEGTLPEEIARRYRLKHDMSLRKLLNDIQAGHTENLTKEFVEEKCKDIICYTALIYGMLMERISNES